MRICTSFRFRIVRLLLAASALSAGVALPASPASAVELPMVWKVNTSLSTGTTFSIPLKGAVNVTIDWGGTMKTGCTRVMQVVSSARVAPVTCSYAAAGSYTISITGTATRLGYNSGETLYKEHAAKLTSVTTWGTFAPSSMEGAFRNAKNLTSVPSSLPVSVTNTAGMFNAAQRFNAPIGSWDVSRVSNMASMFEYALAFNQPLGSWNTAKVTSMRGMFFYANAFNQQIGSWNTSAVRNMSLMFAAAWAFNQPLGGWNTALVSDMSQMFDSAWAFNQPIGSWNTSQVRSMAALFRGAMSFNQPLSSWQTMRVTNMTEMFRSAFAFSKSISSWCVTAIPTKPTDFDTGTYPTWTQAMKPRWGTCP